MPVIETDQWLNHYLKNKIGSIELDLSLQKDIFGTNLATYFPYVWKDEIHQHLLQNGLFMPNSSDENTIQVMHEKNFWNIAEAELNQLRLDWNGPDIPVFIFPSNIKNDQLRIDLGGKSGLAHQDKVFLFIDSNTSEKDLQTLITHEYNHVCRLNYLNLAEKDIELLDAMILEGLAETAVHKRFGKDFLASWTFIYPLEFALTQWEKKFTSNLRLKKANTLHNDLMYGNALIPKWMGYNIGFHLVSSFAENTTKDMKELLQVPSKTILEKTPFFILD